MRKTLSNNDLGAVQAIRRAALFVVLLLVVLVFALSEPSWDRDLGSPVHEGIEGFGLALITLCVLGRTWCSLYIGGRKKRELVDVGPYSICRNPLYVFSFFGAAGAGAQFGSFTAAIVALVITIVIFAVVVRREEEYLTAKFGDSYRAYCARVPRFIPNFTLWRPVPTVEVQMSLVTRTFLDACVFFAAVPLAEMLEMLQDAHILPVLWAMP